MLVFIISTVSFVTLYEQYLISIPQCRLGPNKNSLMGVIQAFFDGIKLLKKSLITIHYMDCWLFIITMMFFIMRMLF